VAYTNQQKLLVRDQYDVPFAMKEVLVNLMTRDQWALADCRDGMASQIEFGNSDGGYLLLRDLGLRIESKAGDLQLLRSLELHRFLTPWIGRRFVVVCTNHETVKKWVQGKNYTGTPSYEDCCLSMSDSDDIHPEDPMS
jgi:hypothetical protein